jgi:hypothetical protein
MSDLRQASFFARHLLKKGWHFEPFDRRIRWSTYMQQAAFTSALVTSYCRPFAQTRKGSTLPNRVASFASLHERELHRRVLSLRNTVYAHSDVALHQVRPVAIEGYPTAVVTMPVLRLSKEDTELLHSMIERLIDNISERLSEIVDRVAE